MRQSVGNDKDKKWLFLSYKMIEHVRFLNFSSFLQLCDLKRNQSQTCFSAALHKKDPTRIEFKSPIRNLKCLMLEIRRPELAREWILKASHITTWDCSCENDKLFYPVLK